MLSFFKTLAGIVAILERIAAALERVQKEKFEREVQQYKDDVAKQVKLLSEAKNNAEIKTHLSNLYTTLYK